MKQLYGLGQIPACSGLGWALGHQVQGAAPAEMQLPFTAMGDSLRPHVFQILHTLLIVLQKDNQDDTATDNRQVTHCRHPMQFSEPDPLRIVF